MRAKRKIREIREVRQPRLELLPVKPLTQNQDAAFKAFKKGQNLLLHGLPGTGKTFIALALALAEGKKVLIVRSAVSTRDIGFQPGSTNEKMKVYEGPYYEICSKLYNQGNAYEQLKRDSKISFIPTSFVRGLTLDETVVVIDEAQNMNDMELHSVITRLGKDSRLIICGDVRQDDLTNPRFKEVSGLAKTMAILQKMKAIECIEFDEHDIVRGDFVKEYIIVRDKYERDHRE